jgi:hypothetical protein
LVKSKKTEFDPDVVQIARISKALSHPVRVYILHKLSKMDSCCYSSNLVEDRIYKTKFGDSNISEEKADLQGRLKFG